MEKKPIKIPLWPSCCSVKRWGGWNGGELRLIRWPLPKKRKREKKKMNANELLELAWGIIANAGGGNWEKETAEWQDAAVRWRDNYFKYLREEEEK